MSLSLYNEGVTSGAGVAELADAEDLGFHVSQDSRLLTDAQHSAGFIRASGATVSNLRSFAHSCSSFGYR